MEAAEVLRRYKIGERDFQGVSLRGQNFKGQNLAGVDFSRTDIRSANFTNANLSGAIFQGAKAGLQRRWVIGLLLGLLLLLLLLLLLFSNVSSIFSELLAYSAFHLTYFENQVAGYFSLAALLLFGFVLFRRGILVGSLVFIVAFCAAGTFAGFVSLALVFVSDAVTEVVSDAIVIAVVASVAIVAAIAITVVASVAIATAIAIVTGLVMAIAMVIIMTAVVVVATSVTVAVLEPMVVATAIAMVIVVVALTLLSAYIGWRALQGDPRDAWIRLVAVAAIGGTSFRGATLADVDFSRAYLKSTDFRRAFLRHTRWRDVNKLDCVRPGETYLSYASVRDLVLTGAGQGQSYRELSNLVGLNLHGFNLVEADFSGCNLEGTDLSWANLKGANLSDVNLNEVNLIGIDLSCANLSGLDFSRFDLSCASLREANLSRTQMLGTKFKETILTGACLENWNINSDTNFESVICDYVYLKADQQERRPREGNFKPGEFASLFQKAVDTVDLIFKDGIDWQAFFQSVQDLRSRYAEQDISIQAIEKKRGGAFVVRVEVAEGADKKAIESSAKELYETQLKVLEAKYERQLRLQGEQHSAVIQRLIEGERHEKATLMGVLTTMADNQGPKYDLSNAQFAGGFADTVQGDQIGGSIVDGAAETPSLAEAAAEIQNLLKQLEASNPAATEAEQIAYLSALIPPTRRERFIGALKAAGGAAVEEVPYGAVLKALVEGWQKPNG